LLIEIKFDTTNICCANSAFEVETLVPTTVNINALIIFEHIFVNVYVTWLYWTQISYNVSTVITRVHCWRMETMIVCWRQIDYHVVKLITTTLDFFKHSSNLSIHRNFFLLN